MSGFLLDTDVLSLFAKVDALSLLCKLLGCDRLPMTTGVFNEIIVPLEYGYDFPQLILALAEMVLIASDEVELFEILRMEGKVSASDSELIAICQRRKWVYITMDRVAARCAEEHNVRTVDLHTLLRTIQTKGLLNNEKLRELVEQMERADRTIFPYKDTLFSNME